MGGATRVSAQGLSDLPFSVLGKAHQTVFGEVDVSHKGMVGAHFIKERTTRE